MFMINFFRNLYIILNNYNIFLEHRKLNQHLLPDALNKSLTCCTASAWADIRYKSIMS